MRADLLRRPACRRLLTSALATATIGQLATAQTIEDLRDDLRQSLRDIQFAQSLVGLVLLSDELELSGARYSFDDVEDTDITVYALPFHSKQELWGKDRPKLHIEGTLGWAEARQSLADAYGGQLPGLETSLSTKWRTYGALLGGGLEFPVAKDLGVTPLVDLGLSRIENRTRYGGPGAAASAALFDGIAFNWDAIAFSYGGAVRVDWHRQLGPSHKLEVVGRYDVRWTETIQEDDPAQDFVTRSQLITLHGDVTGPLGMNLFEQPVDWQLGAAYRAFPEETLFGVDQYVQFSGSLLFRTGDRLPYGHGFALSGAVMLGEDFHGWTLGFRLLF
ncbi:MAG: hypothetical protein MUC36_25710 [Planctomycetes bacterium]|jgi:hypothetical protein|nr:hypothetical protein [Planctomycetota bacterium]